jgi:hypothetical protein
LWRSFANKKSGHGVATAAASSTCCAAILLLCFASAFHRRFGDLKLPLRPYYFFLFFLDAARQKTFLATFSSIGMLVYLFVCAFLQFAFWSSADRAG